MKTVDKAFMKMTFSLNKKQRYKWNFLVLEMWGISDFLVDRIRGLKYADKVDQYEMDKITRLHELIISLPVMDDDGKGFYSYGNEEHF